MKPRLVLLKFLITVSSVVVVLPSCSDDPVSPGGGSSGPSWVAWRSPNVFWVSYGLNAIWGSSSRSVFAVGDQGVVIRYDGSKWTLLRCDGKANLNAVWGSASGDVFVVGDEGAVLHYDGRFWRRMSSGTTAALFGVWGRGPNDVYAVGEAGSVLHYNGSVWRNIDSGTDRTLNAVWGLGEWAFAVGDGGTVLRLTSTEARPVDIPTTNPLNDIGGSSAMGLYAVGATGTVLRFDGSAWQPVRSGTTRDLMSVCGTEDGHIIAMSGERLLDFDGREWTFMDVAREGYEGFVDVWGASMRSLFLLEYQAVQQYDGSDWRAFELPELCHGDEPGRTLLDIWGSSGSNVYASGEAGAILHYNAAGWVETTPVDGSVSGIWGLSESELYAVSHDVSEECGPRDVGMCVYSRFLSCDGTTWTQAAELSDRWLESLWADAGDHALAVGSRAVEVIEKNRGFMKSYRTILRYDGTAWSPMIGETTPGRLNDIWGSSRDNVFAVGSSGAILRYDGAVWAEMTSGTLEDLHAVWGASANDVVAVGAGGVILRFDGHVWLPMASGTVQPLHGVWGTSMDDVFAVGGGGTILHFDGTRWTAMPSPTENALYAVWGAGPEDVFAVGQYGTICHYGSH